MRETRLGSLIACASSAHRCTTRCAKLFFFTWCLMAGGESSNEEKGAVLNFLFFCLAKFCFRRKTLG